MALRALSPGVNDTTTAINCVDYLGTVLCRLVERQLEAPYRSDGEGLRLIARGPSFTSLLGQAFDQIRLSAPGNVAIAVRILQVLRQLQARARRAESREAIRRQARLIIQAAALHVAGYDDRREVENAWEPSGDPSP